MSYMNKDKGPFCPIDPSGTEPWSVWNPRAIGVPEAMRRVFGVLREEGCSAITSKGT